MANDKDTSCWTGNQLMNLLGYNSPTTVAFVISLAKKIRTLGDFTTELQAIEFPASQETETFAQELLMRLPQKNAYQKGGKEAAAAVVRRQQQYQGFEEEEALRGAAEKKQKRDEKEERKHKKEVVIKREPEAARERARERFQREKEELEEFLREKEAERERAREQDQQEKEQLEERLREKEVARERARERDQQEKEQLEERLREKEAARERAREQDQQEKEQLEERLREKEVARERARERDQQEKEQLKERLREKDAASTKKVGAHPVKTEEVIDLDELDEAEVPPPQEHDHAMESTSPQLGCTYTRHEIYLMLGGGQQTFLPTKNNRVCCGCFTLGYNPLAPTQVLIGPGPMRKSSALMAVQQGGSLPIFMKQAPHAWEYVGEYRATRYVDLDEETGIRAVREAREAQGHRVKAVVGILYMEKA